MRVLKPIVAEASPTLYQAATRANLTPREQTQVEQMSWAVKKNKELTQMSSADARKEFDLLDPNAQEGLKSFSRSKAILVPKSSNNRKCFLLF